MSTNKKLLRLELQSNDVVMMLLQSYMAYYDTSVLRILNYTKMLVTLSVEIYFLAHNYNLSMYIQKKLVNSLFRSFDYRLILCNLT